MQRPKNTSQTKIVWKWSAIAFFVFLVWDFPQWIQAVFGLFSPEPLIPWLQKKGVTMPQFSPFWIAGPFAILLCGVFGWLDWKRYKAGQQILKRSSNQIRHVGSVEYRKEEKTGGYWKAYCPKCHMPLVISPPYEGDAGWCSTKCGWDGCITAEEIENTIEWLSKQDKGGK